MITSSHIARDFTNFKETWNFRVILVWCSHWLQQRRSHWGPNRKALVITLFLHCNFWPNSYALTVSHIPHTHTLLSLLPLHKEWRNQRTLIIQNQIVSFSFKFQLFNQESNASHVCDSHGKHYSFQVRCSLQILFWNYPTQRTIRSAST